MEEVIRNMQRWLKDDYDTDSKNKVKWLAEIRNFEVLNDAFCQELQLGFRGVKAKKGVGINRVNQYTVAKLVHALAQYLQRQYPEQEISVVIGYDNREESNRFAHDACKVLTAQDIKVHFTDLPSPSPLLCHCILTLKAQAGISISGGSSSKEYNGLTLYGYQGIPMDSKQLEIIQNYLNEIGSIKEVPVVGKFKLVDFIAQREEEEYIDSLRDFLSPFTKGLGEEVKVVYDPLHGTGALLGSSALSSYPSALVIPVEEHFEMDQKFDGLASPDPHEARNFSQSVEIARQNHADLIVATDADGGKAGLAIKDHVNDFHPLQGHQIAALLLDFMLRVRTPFQHDNNPFFIIKAPTTSRLIQKIAEENHIACQEIDQFDGSQMKNYPAEKILLAIDKEYGFYFPDHVHDRDAFASASLMVAMCAYWKFMGKSLADRLLEIYCKHDYFHEESFALHFPNDDGRDQMLAELNQIQHRFFPTFGKYTTNQFHVFQKGKIYSLHEGDYFQIIGEENARYRIELENDLLIHLNADFNNATLEYRLQGSSTIGNIKEYPTKKEHLNHLLHIIKQAL